MDGRAGGWAGGWGGWADGWGGRGRGGRWACPVSIRPPDGVQLVEIGSQSW